MHDARLASRELIAEAVEGGVSPEYPASRVPQIDALRAFAVTAVLLAHATGTAIPFGHWGVQFFFVISGYLITRLLLEARGTGPRDQAGSLRHFYMRRALRIWPAYYAFLGFLLLVNWNHVRASAGWHLLFVSNVYFWRTDSFDPPITAHLWSLAVEEQFYLFWPFLIYACRRRTLFWLLPLIGLASWGGEGLYRALWTDGATFGVEGLTPFSLLSLSLGGALAVWRAERSGWLRIVEPLGWLGLATIAAAAVAIGPGHLGTWWLKPFETACFVAVLHRVSGQHAGPLTRILSNRGLIYLGTISYGIYLYHMAAFLLLGRIMPLGAALFAATAVLATIAAAISWHCFELPLNRLKSAFPFRHKPARGDIADAGLPGT